MNQPTLKDQWNMIDSKLYENDAVWVNLIKSVPTDVLHKIYLQEYIYVNANQSHRTYSGQSSRNRK